MSDTPGGPTTPAGWYPAGDGWERWWDGNAWSEHHVRPVAGPAPTPAAEQPSYQQPPYQGAPYAGAPHPGQQPGQPGGYQPVYGQHVPASTSNGILKAVLITAGVLLVLLVGGCTAFAVLVGTATDRVLDEQRSEATAPGGSDNPLEVGVGEAFEVRGFSYAAGWQLETNGLDVLDITGLTVTNDRDATDSAFIDVTFLLGGEQVAEATCTSGAIAPGSSEELNCFSGDPVPTSYDTVTVADSF